VLEAGSFTKAARMLGRDATVVSRRLSALEDRLGVRLVERTTRSVSATEAGEALFERARAILDQLSDAESEAGAHAGTSPRGVLRLSLPTTFGRMWVAPHLPAFLAKYPGIRIEAAFSNRYVDLVGERFDVAVRCGQLDDSGLVVKKVADQHRLLSASPAYLAKHGAPRSPSDLARHACLGFSGLVTHPFWNLVDGSGKRVAVRTKGPFLADDADAVLAAAVQGLGIMLATDWFAGPELRDGRLVPVLPGWTTDERTAVYIVHPSSRLLPPKTRAFVDWIARLWSPLPPWQRPSPTKTRKKKPKRR
ncbi:MAG TPA: LysR family transcriptional regulator, partial [Polyangiaceae bacterium]